MKNFLIWRAEKLIILLKEKRKDLGVKSISKTKGEGNGTPLQCSCLENPRDGGAWWAAV